MRRLKRGRTKSHQSDRRDNSFHNLVWSICPSKRVFEICIRCLSENRPRCQTKLQNLNLSSGPVVLRIINSLTSKISRLRPTRSRRRSDLGSAPDPARQLGPTTHSSTQNRAGRSSGVSLPSPLVRGSAQKKVPFSWAPVFGVVKKRELPASAPLACDSVSSLGSLPAKLPI